MYNNDYETENKNLIVETFNYLLSFIKMYIKYLLIFIILFVFFLINQKHQTYLINKSVNIVMSIDNNNIYESIITLTSLLTKSNNTTFLNCHILTPDNFSKKNKKKIQELYNIHRELYIKFYKVGKIFDQFYKKGRVTRYFFLGTQLIIPNLKKYIYLNNNIMIYGDLSELYKINIDNYYYIGPIDYLLYNNNYLLLNTRSFVIDTSVLLVNSEKLKKDKKFNYFIELNNKLKIKKTEQYFVNELEYIDVIPLKYGITYDAKINTNLYYRLMNDFYKEEEINEISNNYTIMIYTLAKPWSPWIRSYKKKQFEELAKKANLYEEMCKYFKIN